MRCRACNAVLAAHEIIWREELRDHEDLCKRCRTYINSDSDLSLVYMEDIIGEGHEDETDPDSYSTG